MSNIRDKINRLKILAEEMPNNTVRVIAQQFEYAINIFINDGDKVSGSTEKSQEARSIIESLLGCRCHQELNCNKWPCNIRKGK